MTIEISDEIVSTSHLTIEEAQLGLAIWLFQEKQVSLNECTKVAGIHKMLFQQELAKRKIPVHDREEDFERDVASVGDTSSVPTISEEKNWYGPMELVYTKDLEALEAIAGVKIQR